MLWPGYCFLFNMFRRIFHFILLCVVFISGVLIGGIYTPEISSYTKAEDVPEKHEQKSIKPLKKERAKRIRSV